ncbi:MAG: sugar transferase [Candidatus Kaiserbacteria bacterium]|nr:sugar transferase [Candidatus Kaiserbacteria bacterium]
MAFDRREAALLLIGDFLILVASLWVALFLRNLAIPSLGYLEMNLLPFLPIFLLSLVVFYIAGLYEKQTRPIRRVMGPRILGAQAATVTIAAVLFFILPLSIAPKTILVLYLIVSVAAESLWRFYRMNREIAEGKRASAILVGTGPTVLELCDEINGNNQYLIRFTDCIETKGLTKGIVAKMITAKIEEGARAVVIDASDPVIIRDLPMLYDLMVNGVTFLEFASLYEEIFDRVPLARLDVGQLLETFPKHRLLYDAAKRLFDIVLAIIGSIIAIPFIAIAAFLLSLAGGTPFIRHERIGKVGRTFRIVKLRSMLFNDNGDPEMQKKNRVTALGCILRKTRIDELPQLWNVLVGDLSFIGPRPELPKIAEVYEHEIPQYRMRHLITPGLSGWAQINDSDAPRGGADVVRTRRKLSFDLYYLKHRSFGLDLAIVTKTLRTLLSFSGT